MFGLGRSTPRYARGTTGGSSKLRGALLAGAGLLAYRWWQNRKQSETGGNRTANGTNQRTGFAAGGTTPGGSAF